MADDFGVDLEEVYRVIDSAELLIVRFHLIQERLFVDFRTRPGEGPHIAVVAPATSVEERMRAIKQARPAFPLPEQIMSFQWPRSIGVLMESGIWDRIGERVVALGGDEGRRAVEAARGALRAKEQAEIVGAIVGTQHYQTLWERQR